MCFWIKRLTSSCIDSKRPALLAGRWIFHRPSRRSSTQRWPSWLVISVSNFVPSQCGMRLAYSLLFETVPLVTSPSRCSRSPEAMSKARKEYPSEFAAFQGIGGQQTRGSAV